MSMEAAGIGAGPIGSLAGEWLEQINLPLLLLDGDDHIRWHNLAFQRLTGRDSFSTAPLLDEYLHVENGKETRIARHDLSEVCLTDAAGNPVLILLSRNRVTTREGKHLVLAIGFPMEAQMEARRQAELLLRETQHRARNLMSIVAAVAAQAFAGIVPETRLNDFVDRLRSLDAALRAACDVASDRCSLMAVVRRVTDRFHQPGDARLHLTGDDVEVSPDIATKAGMILHELCTNATKHGALSVSAGRVTIALHHLAEERRDVVIEWRELGGPPLSRPVSTGAGLKLIERLGTHPSCQVTLRFPPTGLACRIAFATDQAVAMAG